jgi:hypothetical protein
MILVCVRGYPHVRTLNRVESSGLWISVANNVLELHVKLVCTVTMKFTQVATANHPVFSVTQIPAGTLKLNMVTPHRAHIIPAAVTPFGGAVKIHINLNSLFHKNISSMFLL